MANDENVNNSHFNQYINFDQFLMQHNIGNSVSPLNQRSVGNGGNASSRAATSHHNNNNNTQRRNGASPESEQSNDRARAVNSNLVATAAEFVPRTNRVSSTLPVDAEEFIPRTQQKTAADTSRKSESKNYRGRKESNNTLANAADSLANVLNATRISDSGNVELRSSGGAIKKVRNQNQRNDSNEKHNGE